MHGEPEYWVVCVECGTDVQVGFGTFRRVIARESFMLCETCSASAGGQGGRSHPCAAQPPRDAA